MTTKHEIEIEGLPDGFRAVSADLEAQTWKNRFGEEFCMARIKLEKIKPRRIVLEKTGEYRPPEDGEWFEGYHGFYKKVPNDIREGDYKIWHEVKEE